MTSPRMFWNAVVRRLEEKVPPFVLDAWIRPLVPETHGDGLLLSCPSALHRERIRQRYLEQICKLAAIEAGRGVPIELDVAVAPAARPPGARPDAAPAVAVAAAETEAEVGAGAGAGARAGGAGGNRGETRGPARPRAPRPAAPVREVRAPAARVAEPERLPERRGRRPRAESVQYSFDNFVVGSCNRLAREASFAVAEGRQQPVNPLYLASQPGLGKTHLARAISRARHGRGGRVIYRSAESFTNQFTTAIRNKKMDQFKRRYRGCDLLVVEDVQFLGGKKATQLELFHTLSHLLDVGARVVLTGDRLPREIAGLDERLGSHMSAGLVASLEPPDALVRREILRVKAAGGAVALPDDCLDVLVDVVRGNVRDLEGALVQLVTMSSLLKRPIDLDLTEHALRKLSSVLAPARRLDVKTISEAVATFYRTSPELLAARSRRRDVAVPRQIAMYLCRRYTNRPVSEIARAFGRKHPSVANAVSVVEKRMLENAPFRYRVEAIAARLDELERAAPKTRG